MKKGFTLIELLAVIVILAVLGLLLTPLVTRQINTSKEELYTSQMENIKEGAKNWSADNIDKLPEIENKCISVKLSTLKNQGYVDKKVVNPNTKEEFDENFGVKITFSNGNYKYEVLDNVTSSSECTIYE